jgi:hypothetical protein
MSSSSTFETDIENKHLVRYPVGMYEDGCVVCSKISSSFYTYTPDFKKCPMLLNG